jgi:hypothetical protein
MYIKNPLAKWRWDGHDGKFILVYAPAVKRYYLLNPTAALIFSMLDGNTGIGMIVEELKKTENLDRIRSDVDKTISQFSKIGVILDADMISGVNFKKDAILTILNNYCKSLSISSFEEIGANAILKQINNILSFTATYHIAAGKDSPIMKSDCEKLRIQLRGDKDV